MARNIFDYFAKRAEEEARLAAASTIPIVRQTHERFAAFYRERVAFQSSQSDQAMGAGSRPSQSDPSREAAA